MAGPDPDRLGRRSLLTGLALLPLAAAGLAGCSPRERTASQTSARTLSFTDDVRREVTLKLPVRRAVVFNRYTTEFVRAVAGTDVLVGVDIKAGSAYWPTITPQMFAGQGQTNPNFEAIVALRPDVVFFPRNSDWRGAADTLAPFGIPVVVLTCWDVLKHEENAALIGRIFEQPARAEKLGAFYRNYRNLLAERLEGVTRKRVYLEEVGDYKTLLKGSGWHDMIEQGGGLNVFGDVSILGQPAARGTVQGFQVDPEEILARRPEVIIKLQKGQYEPHAEAASRDILERLVARPGFAQLPAVRDGRVYHLSYYHASASSKIVGALQIAKWLYPDRFADVEPEAAMKTWLEQFQGVPYPSTGRYWTSLPILHGAKP
ncbi:ABC transporter substrate-binding protein [Caulobacter endophyticus]|uniref:ABC transporter substrate-binding protein n=1 Tax=Caulobacter endophyticus TaxID=2172652 RepID=UPI00241049FD|nr:ABC transporter substrate-binding protein [Caulobacter endophyticus]MDG2527920.1 ABC transporter substrate-binding protein [Caulobacter endophyticus]